MLKCSGRLLLLLRTHQGAYLLSTDWAPLLLCCYCCSFNGSGLLFSSLKEEERKKKCCISFNLRDSTDHLLCMAGRMQAGSAPIPVLVKCRFKISFKSFAPKQKLAYFLPSCIMDKVKVCLHFLLDLAEFSNLKHYYLPTRLPPFRALKSVYLLYRSTS